MRIKRLGLVIYQINKKKSSKYCSDILQKLFNDAFKDANFTDKLKCADVTPVFTNDDLTKAKNYI